jgi:RNA polymerase sigma factor (sigma-70 family)
MAVRTAIRFPYPVPGFFLSQVFWTRQGAARSLQRHQGPVMSVAGQRPTEVERFRADLDRTYRGPLVAYFLRRVGDRSEAEDLTQEVFARVLNRSETIEPARAEAYVFAAAANLLRDRARRSITRHKSAHTAMDDTGAFEIPELTEEISPERVLVGKETLREVLLALDGLSLRTRDIFVLYRIERMKQHEIAALFGLSHGAVEKHLVKAMTYLTQRFERP